MFESITTIFFDLDNTLFDHSRAEASTLKFLLRNGLEANGAVNEDDFVACYVRHNTQLWQEMAEGTISPEKVKVQRFERTLAEFDLDCSDCAALSRRYLEIYSQQNFCLPHARDVLIYLNPTYELGVLSNGFAQIQRNKLSNLDFMAFFPHQIFSGDVGCMKPAAEIFNVAMAATKTTADELLYVGDSFESDIVGAHAAGWKTILLNPSQKPVPERLADTEIQDLVELKRLL